MQKWILVAVLAGLWQQQRSTEVEHYVLAAQQARDPVLVQLALARAHQAGWSTDSCRSLEKLAAVYAYADLLTQGPIKQTNNPFDLAIEGKGFFCLHSPTGGDLYTRCGQFCYDWKQRQIVDGVGNRLGVEFRPDYTNVEISPDGAIKATLLNGDGKPEFIGQIDLVTFDDPTGMERVGEHLYRAGTTSGARKIGVPGKCGRGSPTQGHLEQNWLPDPRNPRFFQ